MKKKKKEIVVSITAVISLIVVCVELVTAIIHLDGKGGSGNTVINVQEGDGVNVIGDENIFRIEINTKKDDNVLSKITDSTQIYTQRIDNIDEQIWESEEDVLKCIKINYIIENYEKVIDLAEKYGLQDTEYMLNVFGVMYAQGIYFEQDYEKAIQYLTAATEYGNMENTFLNLWLVSYEKDKEEVEKTLFPYQNVYEAVLVAEKHANEKINKIIEVGAYLYMGEVVGDGYTFIHQLSNSERKAFFDVFSVRAGVYKYIVCNQYDYYADMDGDVISNIKAYARSFEERTIPISIYVGESPSKYTILDDIEVIPTSSNSSATVTGTFEYETSYIDENGDLKFWIDTDNFFYGDNPPKDTEDSRWVIQGYEDGKYDERKFRQQVKQ